MKLLVGHTSRSDSIHLLIRILQGKPIRIVIQRDRALPTPSEVVQDRQARSARLLSDTYPGQFEVKVWVKVWVEGSGLMSGKIPTLTKAKVDIKWRLERVCAAHFAAYQLLERFMLSPGNFEDQLIMDLE